MNKIKLTLLFALAFVFSCSNDGKTSVCSNVQTIELAGEELQYGECYDGTDLITELECLAIPDLPVPGSNRTLKFEYKENGKCPSGEKKQCKSNFPFPLAILHEYGGSFICDK